MISLGAQRWWAGFFAVAGGVMSLAGLLFGVGLLVVPTTMVILPGDSVAPWAWAVPAAALVLSVATFMQVALRRPLLSTRALRTERFNYRGRKRYELVIAFVAISILMLLGLAIAVLQAALALGPRERGAAWSFASMAFGMEAFVFALLSFVLFVGWWKARGGDSAPSPSRECPECGYPLGKVTGGSFCPECGWQVKG